MCEELIKFDISLKVDILINKIKQYARLHILIINNKSSLFPYDNHPKSSLLKTLKKETSCLT